MRILPTVFFLIWPFPRVAKRTHGTWTAKVTRLQTSFPWPLTGTRSPAAPLTWRLTPLRPVRWIIIDAFPKSDRERVRSAGDSYLARIRHRNVACRSHCRFPSFSPAKVYVSKESPLTPPGKLSVVPFSAHPFPCIGLLFLDIQKNSSTMFLPSNWIVIFYVHACNLLQLFRVKMPQHWKGAKPLREIPTRGRGSFARYHIGRERGMPRKKAWMVWYEVVVPPNVTSRVRVYYILL